MSEAGRLAAERRAARLAAVQTLYAIEISGICVDDALQDHLVNRQGREVEGDRYVPADLELLGRTVRGALDHAGQIGEWLDGVLDKPGGMARIEPLLRAVLRAGASELEHNHDTDAPIILKDYTEVAQAFYDGAEAGLVNAALDRLARQLRPGALKDRSPA